MSSMGERRLAICEKCGLYKIGTFGPVCNSSKYINKEGKVSFFPKEGYFKGCSCLLEKKVENADNHCVAGFW